MCSAWESEIAVDIGILGTGRVAQALAPHWLLGGHRVCFGSRDPDTRRAALESSLIQGLGAEAAAGLSWRPVDRCVEGSEIVVVAVPWDAALASLEQLRDGRRRIVIDCINPLRPDLKGKVIDDATSTLRVLQDHFPASDFVKAFNSASSAVMADSHFDQVPSMPICGDNEVARQRVAELVAAAGFEPIDCGDSLAATWLEAVTLLTIRMAIQNRWKGDCAVKWERRESR